ncbi:MAG: FKBP-type peptidyl-prolyl cis-trans isomerase [Planctomycetota bacterium]|nr:FKBP-type peptidyl-prolyl cis-trans isomerase [Planctomycetota bacterium]
MPITVLSPYSGKQVKVRDNDAGRAVRDEEGRIFYVMPKSDGTGYYGATTRAGNAKEEARALELESKVAVGQGEAKSRNVEMQEMRKPGRSMKGPVILLVLVALLAAAGWAFFYGPLKDMNPLARPATPPAEPAPASKAPPVESTPAPSTEKALAAAAAASGQAPAGVAAKPMPDPDDPTRMALPSGLRYKVVKPGTGEAVKFGDRVQVRYTGAVVGGERFESSDDNEAPFLVTVGAARNLKFWNEALPGMTVGEKRSLTVPPALAYGSKGTAIVKGNSTLTYDVELLAIIKAKPEPTP